MSSFLCVLKMAPADLVMALRARGWDRPELLRRLGVDDEWDTVVDELVPQLSLEAKSEYVANLMLLAGAAARPGTCEVNRAASFTNEEVASYVTLSKRASKRARQTVTLQEAVQLPPGGDEVTASAMVARWPGQTRRKEVAGDAPRASKEAADRAKWVLRAAAFAVEAELPVISLMQAPGDIAAVAKVIGQGRRARTIYRRITDWKKVRAFLAAAHGTTWPQCPADFLDYLMTRAEEPCHPIRPLGALSALTFLERGGGVNTEHQIGQNLMVRGAVEEMALNISGHDAAPIRKAPRYALALVLAWEAEVADQAKKRYTRLYTWWMLLKLWGSLRFDDQRGIDPKQMRLGSQGLVAKLTRTKTTGSSKRVRVLPLFVSRSAYVWVKDWLEIGFNLWQAEGTDRDFFLLIPSQDGEGTRRHEATYSDAAGTSRRVNLDLQAFVITDQQLVHTGGPVLCSQAASFWTEHSQRATLVSWCSLVGSFPQSWLDALGRWGANGAAGYDRTYRSRAQTIQAKIASSIRASKDPHALLDESTLLEELEVYLGTKGASDIEALKQSSNLIAVTGPLEADIDLDTSTTESMADSGAKEAPASGADFEAGQNLGLYVVSIRNHGRTRVLHQVGKCHRQPGQDYSRFESLGFEPPPPERFTSRCRDCWAQGSLQDNAGASENDSSSTSSSRSSSSISSSSEAA